MHLFPPRPVNRWWGDHHSNGSLLLFFGCPSYPPLLLTWCEYFFTLHLQSWKNISLKLTSHDHPLNGGLNRAYKGPSLTVPLQRGHRIIYQLHFLHCMPLVRAHILQPFPFSKLYFLTFHILNYFYWFYRWNSPYNFLQVYVEVRKKAWFTRIFQF